jgi:DNA repair protein RecN (Recombination protein N)
MLAIKAVLGEADHTGILVFDEIDAGIGGATGLAVGAKLKALAASHQVIVVTHLAQVAAFADAHFVVRKGLGRAGTEGSSSAQENQPDESSTAAVQEGDVQTTVSAVTGTARVQEIARMLSGETHDIALAHARELLAKAGHLAASAGTDSCGAGS